MVKPDLATALIGYKDAILADYAKFLKDIDNDEFNSAWNSPKARNTSKLSLFPPAEVARCTLLSKNPMEISGKQRPGRRRHEISHVVTCLMLIPMRKTFDGQVLHDT